MQQRAYSGEQQAAVESESVRESPDLDAHAPDVCMGHAQRSQQGAALAPDLAGAAREAGQCDCRHTAGASGEACSR